jgi:hydrogenase expression/formation protein HypC
MEIVAVDGTVGWAQAPGRAPEAVDLSLTGPLPVGSWALVFLGAAREPLAAEEAAKITAALDGLAAVMRGEDPGDAFADLDARTPTLPPHLEAARRAGRRAG